MNTHAPHSNQIVFNNSIIDLPAPGKTPDVYWQRTELSYPHYPTVRHRKRFILNAVSKYAIDKSDTLFDFGCGEGELLTEIMANANIPPSQAGGCDISEYAISQSKKRIRSQSFYAQAFPKVKKMFSVMVCSEVIEHTTEYAKVIAWMSDHLKKNGLLILTTQAGVIHNSDIYTGHTQHFNKEKLEQLIERAGMEILESRLWGFPFFTIQKYMTDLNFNAVRTKYLEGRMTLRKKLLFGLAYAFYLLHDLISFGPQIYIIARKR